MKNEIVHGDKADLILYGIDELSLKGCTWFGSPTGGTGV